MRKLFRFYLLCYYYLLLFPIMLVAIFLYFYGAIIYFTIDYNEYHKQLDIFLKNITKLLEDKIAEIKKEEHEILNADIIERCLKGEYGLRVRQVSWRNQIIFTLALVLIAVYFTYQYFS